MREYAYTCSDPDCSQYYRRVNDFYFRFYEIRKLPEAYVICGANICLTAYDVEFIKTVCSSYYESLEDIVQQYGFYEGLRIMAECIFEQKCFLELDFTESVSSREEAEAVIKQMIRRM